MADERHSHSSSARGSSHAGVDIPSMIRDVLRQWWVILLAAVTAAALLGAYLQFTYTPEYTAATVFVVKKSGVSSNPIVDNLNAATAMTDSFSTLVESSILENRVCRNLGLSTLDAAISINTVESTNLMTLTVRASSSQMAYSVITAVMDIAEELCGELSSSISIQTVQPATIPTFISNPLNVRRQMTRGAVLGAAAMAVLFAFLSYWKDSVKNETDMKNKVDAKHLATIWHERKYKTVSAALKRPPYSMRIDNPTLGFRYVEANRMMATRIRRELDKQGSKVLMVTSVTENEGKSTVAANIALSLAQEDRQVALLDCDFCKPSQYKIFGLNRTKLAEIDFGKAIRSHTALRFTPAGLQRKLFAAFTVVPSNASLRVKDVEYLNQILDFLRGKMDYIILDSSPFGLVAESEGLANLADASVLVVKQNGIEARYVNDTIDQLNETRGRVLGCIFNNVHTSFLQDMSTAGSYGRGYGYGYGYGYGRRNEDAEKKQ